MERMGQAFVRPRTASRSNAPSSMNSTSTSPTTSGSIVIASRLRAMKQKNDLTGGKSHSRQRHRHISRPRHLKAVSDEASDHCKQNKNHTITFLFFAFS